MIQLRLIFSIIIISIFGCSRSYDNENFGTIHSDSIKSESGLGQNDLGKYGNEFSNEDIEMLRAILNAGSLNIVPEVIIEQTIRNDVDDNEK